MRENSPVSGNHFECYTDMIKRNRSFKIFGTADFPSLWITAISFCSRKSYRIRVNSMFLNLLNIPDRLSFAPGVLDFFLHPVRDGIAKYP